MYTALTVPDNGELTTVSIFMAERTHSGCPFSTFHHRREQNPRQSNAEIKEQLALQQQDKLNVN